MSDDPGSAPNDAPLTGAKKPTSSSPPSSAGVATAASPATASVAVKKKRSSIVKKEPGSEVGASIEGQESSPTEPSTFATTTTTTAGTTPIKLNHRLFSYPSSTGGKKRVRKSPPSSIASKSATPDLPAKEASSSQDYASPAQLFPRPPRYTGIYDDAIIQGSISYLVLKKLKKLNQNLVVEDPFGKEEELMEEGAAESDNENYTAEDEGQDALSDQNQDLESESQSEDEEDEEEKAEETPGVEGGSMLPVQIILRETVAPQKRRYGDLVGKRVTAKLGPYRGQSGMAVALAESSLFLVRSDDGVLWSIPASYIVTDDSQAWAPFTTSASANLHVQNIFVQCLRKASAEQK